MKTFKKIKLILLIAVPVSLIGSSCVTTNKISNVTGALLWSENCIRCHNAPSPTDFTDIQWGKIGMHMKVRANLTDDETKKIVEFLQSAN